ncbi:MAG: lactate dehydrogenase [Nitrosopumilus sp.]|uniref:malate dehydrogenase n=1 Tax=Nitrosopumilus sp. TaxID=2024843 RepID=UPI0024324093|nr:lactate dehydrogenase [Nitrosopumilus sp.]MCV0367757.1 lactate dehydrogenase [Nitrosopumilus sp.]
MISIIGSGRVGSSIAFLCASNALDDVLLINRNKDKAIGESLDIANAIPQTSEFSIHGTDDFSKLTDSDIVVIAASTGIYSKDRSENMVSQINMIKDIAEKIKRYCPSAVVLVVSNPLDVLTYFFQKESGFSRFKVIGIASSLDSSRFRYLISEKLSIPNSSILDALVLGEHGDSMVPIFSKVRVDGTSLSSMLDDDEKSVISNKVKNYWLELRKFKSRSQFGIAKNIFDVIEAIVNKKELSFPASVVLDGEYGQSNVAMGVPVRINGHGLFEIEQIELDASETEQLVNSSKKIQNQINSVLS